MALARPITILGKTYPSYRKAAQAHRICRRALARHIAQGQAPDEALARLNAEKPSDLEKGGFTYGGESYPSLVALAHKHSLSYPALRWYLLKGASLEEAVQSAAETDAGGVSVAGLPQKN